MKYMLRKGLLTYEIEAGLSWEGQRHGLDFFNFESAHTFLIGFMGDASNLRVLRSVVGETKSAPLFRMKDNEVIRQAAHLIFEKRISVRTPLEKHTYSGVRVVKTEAEEEALLTAAAKPVEEPPVNVVTPKIEMEYKVVLLDPDLAKHQGPNETKVYADPTYIEVSVEQSNTAFPFKGGGTLSYSSANVAAYLDRACQNKLPVERAPLSNAQLAGGRKTKIYFRGTGSGTFDVSLTLDDPKDASIRVEKPVEGKGKEKIGVVKIEMKLHRQDIKELEKIEVDPDTDPIDTYHTNLKDTDLPEQKEMTTEEKIKEGRLLHVQKDGHFGRAKLVCKKLTAGQWPSGTDDYEVVLKPVRKSGAVEIYDKEWEGELKAAPAIKVADLKASDQVFWVQGTRATTELKDVGLSLGIDRPEGGLAKTFKQNGDWANFSIVEIREIKVDYTPEAGKPVKWDNTQHRFYINMGAAWDDANKKFSTDANTDVNGRKITIGAQLSKALKDVPIHFMLAEDENNRKSANWGEDMPGTWKWKDIDKGLKHADKKKRKDLLHLSAKTDNKGYAKVELTLSRFGGDVFWPGTYIAEDPHLAKYIRGHAELNKKAPVLAVDAVTVWRKFWYQFTKADGFMPPAPAVAVTAYDEVKAEMVRDQTLSFKREASSPAVAGEVVAPDRTFYEKYIIAGGAKADPAEYVANVGDYNKNQIADACYKPKKDQPVKNQLIVCSYQYDVFNRGKKRKATGFSAPITSDVHGTKVKIVMNKPVFDPPLHGGSFVVKLFWKRESSAVKHNIASAKATIPSPRTNNREIEVEVPEINPAPAAGNAAVRIYAKCWSPWGPYLGESFGKHSLIVYDSSDEADYNDTVVHEIGHALNQTPRPGAQPTGSPDHPTQHDAGQGNHCRVTNTAGKFKCVMYDSGPNPDGIHKYCETCHPYLIAENYSSFKEA